MNIALFIEVASDHLLLFQDDEQIATLAAETAHIFFAVPEEAASFEFVENDKGTYDLLMDWRGVQLKGVRE